MRSDYNKRKKSDDPGKRVMLYVHGGAYYFGSVDEHRYQMQRHARKLHARVFAPRYRLAPQFPFPCGLQDCLAAYLYLLKTIQDPSNIILAGDSAGGGMVLSILVTIRDRGLPMPAGAILLSPWVDLTHSFPSLAGECPLDYIPSSGFHHKPSLAWPPLNADEYAILTDQIARNTRPGHTKLMKPASVELKRQSQDLEIPAETTQLKDGSPVKSWTEATYLSIQLDGKEVLLKDQLQMYTTNELLSHPLVSPIMQPSLGGLPPLLIITGGGEILRDEQIYLAHKCAQPEKYPLGDVRMNEAAREQISRFKPTDVQLQIWDDLCHVAPTLSFTRPAKYMYRAIAQFGTWALARAQQTQIEILDDDQISVISSSSSTSGEAAAQGEKKAELLETGQLHVGKAGDPLPPFKNHMIRQRVSRHGVIRPLEPASELPGCVLDPSDVGVIKEGPVRKWLEARRQWDNRFGTARAKVHKRRLKEMMAGYLGFDGETPPPSALAARRKTAGNLVPKKKRKGMGLALWSLWGSKHDEMEVQRKEDAEKNPEATTGVEQESSSTGSPPNPEGQERDANLEMPTGQHSTIGTEHQTSQGEVHGNTPIAILMAKRQGKAPPDVGSLSLNHDSVAPNSDLPPFTGVTGKRPIVSGIAVPFSLDKDAETASMITLTSATDESSRPASPSLGSDIDRVFAASAEAEARSEPDTTAESDSPKGITGTAGAISTVAIADEPETPVPALQRIGHGAADRRVDDIDGNE
ncbi:alpha/beta-hydrolase [Xylaria intraflava]|nr:alpha/beta-hydrolase [Xylaria intraflava]